MKKIILIVLLLVGNLLATEFKLGSESVSRQQNEINQIDYVCINNKVVGIFINKKKNVKIKMPIYWTKHNKNVKLDCVDYIIWRNKSY